MTRARTSSRYTWQPRQKPNAALRNAATNAIAAAIGTADGTPSEGQQHAGEADREADALGEGRRARVLELGRGREPRPHEPREEHARTGDVGCRRTRPTRRAAVSSDEQPERGAPTRRRRRATTVTSRSAAVMPAPKRGPRGSMPRRIGAGSVLDSDMVPPDDVDRDRARTTSRARGAAEAGSHDAVGVEQERGRGLGDVEAPREVGAVGQVDLDVRALRRARRRRAAAAVRCAGHLAQNSVENCTRVAASPKRVGAELGRLHPLARADARATLSRRQTTRAAVAASEQRGADASASEDPVHDQSVGTARAG